MNINDAAKILGIDGKIDADIVKKAYRMQCKKFHPDRNPAGLEMMKAINVAYDTLKNVNADVSTSDINYSEKLNDAINAIIDLEGIIIEICGTWVWLSGETKKHKEIIKKAGFFWARKKKMWYFRPADYKSKSYGKYSIDRIRDIYGSKEVTPKYKKQLSYA